jgi:hypothetical protein
MIEEFKKKLTETLRKKEINLIIFGETHGFLDDNSIQEEIIKIFKPTLFLYELLEETKLLSKEKQEEFLKQPNEKDFSIISTFGELKKTIKLAKSYSLPIIGNDIKNLGRENKDFLKKTELTAEEIKIEKEILSKREEKQSKEIINFFNKREKILVTTGAFHLRKKSPLLNLYLSESYLIIYTSYKGKQIFEPPEDFDISKVVFEIKEIS